MKTLQAGKDIKKMIKGKDLQWKEVIGLQRIDDKLAPEIVSTAFDLATPSKDKISVQVDVQGFSDLHKKVCRLVEVPCSAYKNLHDGWWLFEGT